MKRSVQILLILAILVPIFSAGREETMEERKHRITRKYLRERTDIFQSDEVIQVGPLEDEAVIDAERFKMLENDLKQEEITTMPPQQRRYVPVQKQRNWLLAEEDEAVDPHASPYGSVKKDRNTPELGELPIQTLFEDQTQYGFSNPKDSWYKPREKVDATVADETRNRKIGREIIDSRDTPWKTEQKAWSPRTVESRQAVSPRATEAYGIPDRKTPSFDASGRYVSPFQGLRTPSFSSSPGTDRTRGYTPYKSPYQTREDPRTMPTSPLQGPQSGFKRVDPYKTWKSESPARRDPTRSDAYVDDLMPKFGQ